MVPVVSQDTRRLLRFGRFRRGSSAVAPTVWQEKVMFGGCCTEPSLDELFGDTAIQLLMRRDGVRESDVRALLCELSDARAAASVGTARERGASKCANRAPGREE